MSSTTQVTTFSDLYTDLQNRAREETGVTTTQTIAKRFINIGLMDMHIGYGESFPWAEQRATLITRPKYTTGLVTVTAGDINLTGVADADGNSPEWNTAADVDGNNMNTGGKIVVNGGPEVYEITGVITDTAAGITPKWLGTTIDATTQTDNGASYVYFEDEYNLATDFLRPIDQRSFTDNREIALIDRTQFRRRFPRNSTPGRPKIATIVDRAGEGFTSDRRVRLYPPPDQTYALPYTYVTSKLVVDASGDLQTSFSADTDQPIVPLPYRHLIVLHALFNLYRDRKDDARSQEVKAEFIDLMTRVTSDVEIGSKRPRINPNIQRNWMRARRPYTVGTGRYDVGGRFDRME